MAGATGSRNVRTGLAGFVAAPSILAAVGLVAIELARLVRPDTALFAERRPASLGAAIVQGRSVETVHAFVHAGGDPNGVVRIRHKQLTGGEEVEVSPLVLAVAARNENVVRMLVAFGAAPDAPQNRLARCLARALHAPGIVDILASASDSTGAAACPPLLDAPEAVPLAWFARRQPGTLPAP